MKINQDAGGSATIVRAHNDSTWRVGYPNPADFNFDYYRLLDEAKQSGIGSKTQGEVRIAVVGAGIAGLTAARELFRSGYTDIDIFEAADRLGGRLYSRPVDGQHTVFEMGAMRLPLFEQNGRSASALGHYREQFAVTTQPFPEAGAGAGTGIYTHDGYGPDIENPFPSPKLLLWKQGEGLPPDALLAKIAEKWGRFAGLFTAKVAERYGTPAWDTFWREVVANYWTLSFRRFVHLPALPAWDPARPGAFGGLGLNEREADAATNIGVGDGGWKAYLDASCLYIFRTLLFGFATDLQLFQGRFDRAGRYQGGPHCGEALGDSLGNPLPAPRYLGVQSVAECMFFMQVESDHVAPVSLYDAMRGGDYRIRLFTRSTVGRIERLESGKVRVAAPRHEGDYDAVILTAPTSVLEVCTRFIGFPATAFPPSVRDSMKSSHWVSSCKVFVALKERYWEKSDIPQLLSTDTFVQRVYGYALETASVKDPGVLILSYTWEDDADRLLAETDEALVSACLLEIDTMLARSGIEARISDFVDRSQSAVIHWSREPSFRGIARAYRERAWSENQALSTYNQEFSAESKLYFAGEAFSVEGGWTEAALRTSLDAVLHVIHNTDGILANGFDFSRDYPKYDMQWSPNAP